MDNLCLALEARELSPRLCVTDGGLALDREVADSFPACLIAHADPYVEPAVLSHLADGPAQAVKARLRALPSSKPGARRRRPLRLLWRTCARAASARTRP